MARKCGAVKLRACCDPLFDAQEVGRLVNLVMVSGKKTVAARIVYTALAMLSPDRSRSYELLMQALHNIKPSAEIRTRRMGGASYRVPAEICAHRRMSLALRWLKSAAMRRRERYAHVRLYNEILDALCRRGGAVRQRDEVHRLAHANRAFSHSRRG
ncbi:30S ribosomal protein S7 [Candidatus Tremblaya princeps]|jgi:small subunit ribosomal protein S7|uniref:Small ribosomal subunit protein uS7 n=1 Tax=Tremblaya princeps TaxID=189385 RepID=A0A143WPG6_TREPR|nr:30S ribosomal protein S7 [Candidatus Tremblaya princeps]